MMRLSPERVLLAQLIAEREPKLWELVMERNRPMPRTLYTEPKRERTPLAQLVIEKRWGRKKLKGKAAHGA